MTFVHLTPKNNPGVPILAAKLSSLPLVPHQEETKLAGSTLCPSHAPWPSSKGAEEVQEG